MDIFSMQEVCEHISPEKNHACTEEKIHLMAL